VGCKSARGGRLTAAGGFGRKAGVLEKKGGEMTIEQRQFFDPRVGEVLEQIKRVQGELANVNVDEYEPRNELETVWQMARKMDKWIAGTWSWRLALQKDQDDLFAGGIKIECRELAPEVVIGALLMRRREWCEGDMQSRQMIDGAWAQVLRKVENIPESGNGGGSMQIEVGGGEIWSFEVDGGEDELGSGGGGLGARIVGVSVGLTSECREEILEEVRKERNVQAVDPMLVMTWIDLRQLRFGGRMDRLPIGDRDYFWPLMEKGFIDRREWAAKGFVRSRFDNPDEVRAAINDCGEYRIVESDGIGGRLEAYEYLDAEGNPTYTLELYWEGGECWLTLVEGGEE